MTLQDHESEVDRNFDFFQTVVPTLMKEHAGKHAIVRHQKVDSFYDSSATALIEGYKKFPDGLFSVQTVTITPVDLGFFSHVASIRNDQK
jgi:hypothetical protein